MSRWKLLAAAVSLLAVPAFAQTPPLSSDALRITITSKKPLPDPEALVKSLETQGGRHEVRVKVQRTQDGESLTLDLWGDALADATARDTLEKQFPQLVDADLEITHVRENPPKVEADGAQPGDQVIVKKKIIRHRP